MIGYTTPNNDAKLISGPSYKISPNKQLRYFEGVAKQRKFIPGPDKYGDISDWSKSKKGSFLKGKKYNYPLTSQRNITRSDF
jgi:hypothetical protein